MNKEFSLLTQFPWRFHFNSHGLKSIGLISSSADVRHSRGEFDRIWRLIMTNPTPIGSRLSLDIGESWWTQDLPKNCLITSWFNQKLRYKGREHRFIGENPAKIASRPIRWGTIDGHDFVVIMGHGPTIHDRMIHVTPSDPHRKVLVCPRVAPHSDDATHASPLFRLFDEDRKLPAKSCVARWGVNQAHFNLL